MLEEVRRILEELPSREQEIIFLYFGFSEGKSWTQEQLAQQIHVSQFYLLGLLKKSLQRIRIRHKEEGLMEASKSFPNRSNPSNPQKRTLKCWKKLIK